MDALTTLPWQAWLTGLAFLCVCAGRADRWVERRRFKVTMWRCGYTSHGEYVNGREWKRRRRRFIAEHHRPPCRICRRPFEPSFPIHHRDYARAGAGWERDRDLWMLCERCHVFVHRWDRRRGPFRKLGFSLRFTSWLVCFWWCPVRFARRAVAWWRVAELTRPNDRDATDGQRGATGSRRIHPPHDAPSRRRHAAKASRT